MEDLKRLIDTLTPRQREILRLVAQHLQAKEIARVLNIRETTVKTHTEKARKRLGVATSREAALLLAAHEYKTPVLPEGGHPPSRIGKGAGHLSPSSHDQPLPSERAILHNPLERLRDRLADVSLTGQTVRNRGDPVRGSDIGENRGTRQSYLHDGRGDSVANGRWERFTRRLKGLTKLQTLGMVLLTAVALAMALVLLTAFLAVMFQAIQTLTGQTR